MIRVNIGSLVDGIFSSYDVMRMAFYFVVFLPKTYKFCVNTIETSDKYRLKDIQKTTQLVLLEMVMVIENKESLRNSEPGGTLVRNVT